MTKNEMLVELTTKIEGQGTQVDGGGALPRLIKEIINRCVPIEVEDITALTDAQLDALEVGDPVAKKTGTAKHLYWVSYKDAENGGLCLTYADATTVETVSYDHSESGWAYNSTDVTNIGQ